MGRVVRTLEGGRKISLVKSERRILKWMKKYMGQSIRLIDMKVTRTSSTVKLGLDPSARWGTQKKIRQPDLGT